jgi:hypothetical protein
MCVNIQSVMRVLLRRGGRRCPRSPGWRRRRRRETESGQSLLVAGVKGASYYTSNELASIHEPPAHQDTDPARTPPAHEPLAHQETNPAPDLPHPHHRPHRSSILTEPEREHAQGSRIPEKEPESESPTNCSLVRQREGAIIRETWIVALSAAYGRFSFAPVVTVTVTGRQNLMSGIL